MDGGGGAATLEEFRNPLGSLRVLLTPSMFPGPGGIPLMAEFPAPAEPAIGVPTRLWANEEVDIAAITVSARPSLIDALSMEKSLTSRECIEAHEANVGRPFSGTTKLDFRSLNAVD